MKLLTEYNDARKKLFDYFGYVEDWVVIPVDDATDNYWRIIGGEGYGGCVQYAETKEDVGNDEGGNYYENQIYTQRFLPKWVYRAKDYTMICVNTNVDGNKFLQIFDNEKEIK